MRSWMKKSTFLKILLMKTGVNQENDYDVDIILG